MAMILGLHLYHWHPYELRAFLCGIVGGIAVTLLYVRAWSRWR
jgi:hypothetical protein